MRTLFEFVVLPGFLAVLLLHVHGKTRPVTPETQQQKKQEPSFLAHYFKSCAGFPLVCLILISLVAVFPGRIP